MKKKLFKKLKHGDLVVFKSHLSDRSILKVTARVARRGDDRIYLVLPSHVSGVRDDGRRWPKIGAATSGFLTEDVGLYWCSCIRAKLKNFFIRDGVRHG